MPEAIVEPQTETVTLDAAEAAMATFDKFVQPEVAPAPTPETKPEAPAPKKEVKSFSDLPDELLDDKKAEPEPKPEDDFDKLIAETPTGQIKHDHFKKVQAGAKAAVEKARAELAEAKALLEKQKPGELPDVTKAEMAKLRETLAAREAELERVAYERSPKFQEKFGARETLLREQVLGIGKEYGLAEDDMAGILAAAGKRRDTMVDELDITDGAKRRLSAHLVNLDQLSVEREKELARSRDELTAFNQQQKEAQAAQEAKNRAEEDRVFTEALSEAQQKLAAFRKIEGNDAWNAEAEKRIEYARNFFNGGASMREMADLALLGLDHGVQVKIIGGLRARLNSLMDENAKLKTASPSGGGAPGYKPDESGLSPEERAMRTFDRYVGGA